jgi:outer membrane protein TolC
LVERPFDLSRQTETATSGDLLQMSLTMSPRIQAISQEPLIREAQIIEADADFDPAVFLRNIFEDRTDPVGNTLTTGGAEFLEDHIFTSNTGIRRKLRTGGNLELSQRLGFQNSNSQFFVPQDQGTATLAINLSQPVLRDGGRYFNRLQILIAQAATDVSWEVFSSELQDELQRVLSAYWQLVYDRSNFLQKQRNYERGQQILETLVQRQGLDSLPSQVARARSSVEARKTSLANALRDVRNAESNIRRLTGDPDFAAKQDVELLPLERPIVQDFSIPLKQIVNTALNQRPEIREMAKRTKIAALQLDVSTNQLLPELALLMGTYVSGLEGDTGIERAWVEQFSNTTPGYSLGFEFSRPVGNRAALSRLTQSQLQLRKLENEWKESMQRVISESQIAYRGVESAVQTLKAAMVSIQAAHQDLIQQARRFEEFALIEGDLSDGRSPTTILDQLLDSQERLTSAENLYAQTMLEYQVASIALSRATGTLLLHHRVSFEHGGGSGCLPAVRLYQSPTDGDF